MKWKTARIGDVCLIEKGATGIMKAIPGDFPMVNLSENRTSHNEFQFDAKAVIVPLISSTGHGHASMKRIHFQEGKFALGSILCALVAKNEKELNPKFLFQFLNFSKEELFVPLMRGAANVSLSIKNIAAVEIPLPPIEIQNRIIDQIFEIENKLAPLQTHLAHQSSLLKNLRAAILQEAVQGKLTPTLPADGHAKDLLAAIRAEKKAKNIKEKPLPPVREEEMPFVLPEGWVWCRLGEVALHSEAGKSLKAEETAAKKNEWGVVKTSAVTSGIFVSNENKRFSNPKNDFQNILICKGDIIFCRASGSKELAGVSCLVEKESENKLILSDKTVRYILSDMILKKYVQLFNSTIIAKAYYQTLNTGKSTSMNNITRDQFDNLGIPLPPLATQHRIVKKVEHLLAQATELETANAAQQKQAAGLLSAALREAFAGG